MYWRGACLEGRMAHAVRIALVALLLAACGGSIADDEAFDHEGKFLTSDAIGRKALPVNLDTSSQVWEVTTIWGDTTSAAARAPGMAWGANSGLRWDKKFARWV